MAPQKYKVGDFIKILGKCGPEMLGRTVKIHMYDSSGHYFIDTLDLVLDYYPLWNKDACEANSKIDTTYTVLHGSKI